MALMVAQAGTDLYLVDPASGGSFLLTLPTGVTLSEDRKPRFAVLDRWCAVTNSPSQNLAIDPDGNVLLLTPTKPASAPTIAAGGTGLNGSYFTAVSFIILDADGDVVMESSRSDNSNTVSLANEGISFSSIPTSGDSVPSGFTIGRRLYRTTSGGTLLYKLADIANNTDTTYGPDGTDDAALELIPVEPEDSEDPPGAVNDGIHMKVVVSWNNRLWGASDDAKSWDDIRFTDDGKPTKWTGTITARPKGGVPQGVVALVPRRNSLLILKRNGVWQITGDSEANFAIDNVVEGRGGCISADSVVVINDEAYWLGNDGVYRFGPNGLESLTDGDVAPWFKKDVTFNRARFTEAFAKFNAPRNQYELHLAAAGSSAEDRWVAFNTVNKKWYGPHDTDACTPTCAALVQDNNGTDIVVVGGSDGRCYTMNNETFTDGPAEAIDFDCTTGWYHEDNPNVEHCWDALDVLTKVQTAGVLTIVPTLGRTNALPGAPMTHDMTLGREELDTLGDGAMVRLRFRQNVAGQGVSLYGFEAAAFEVGKR